MYLEVLELTEPFFSQHLKGKYFLAPKGNEDKGNKNRGNENKINSPESNLNILTHNKSFCLDENKGKRNEDKGNKERKEGKVCYLPHPIFLLNFSEIERDIAVTVIPGKNKELSKWGDVYSGSYDLFPLITICRKSKLVICSSYRVLLCCLITYTPFLIFNIKPHVISLLKDSNLLLCSGNIFGSTFDDNIIRNRIKYYVIQSRLILTSFPNYTERYQEEIFDLKLNVFPITPCGVFYGDYSSICIQPWKGFILSFGFPVLNETEKKNLIASLTLCKRLFVFSRKVERELRKFLGKYHTKKVPIILLEYPEGKNNLPKWSYRKFKEIKQKKIICFDDTNFISPYLQKVIYNGNNTKEGIGMTSKRELRDNFLVKCLCKRIPVILPETESNQEVFGEDYPLFYSGDLNLFIEQHLGKDLIKETYKYLKKISENRHKNYIFFRRISD